MSGTVDAERVEVLRTAIRAMGDADTPERARLLARLCSEIAYRPLQERLSVAHKAKTMARRLDDSATLVAVITDCSLPLRVPSTLRDQLADVREATEIAEQTGDPLGGVWTAAWAYVYGSAAGDFELADRCLATEQTISARLQEPAMVWVSSFQEAARALRRGETNRAQELSAQAFEIGRASGQPDAFTFYGSQLMVIRDQQGRFAELVDLIADVAEQNPGMPLYKAVLAWAYNEAGDAATARQLLDAAAADRFDLPLDSTWVDGIISYANVAVRLHVPEHAEQLFNLLAPYHDQVCLARASPTTRAGRYVPRRHHQRARALRRLRALFPGGRPAKHPRHHAVRRGADQPLVGTNAPGT